MSAVAGTANAAWLLPRRTIPARVLALAAVGSVVFHTSIVYFAGSSPQPELEPSAPAPGVEVSVLPSDALFDEGGRTAPVARAAMPEPAAPAAPAPAPDIAAPAPRPEAAAQAPPVTAAPVQPPTSAPAPVVAPRPAAPLTGVAVVEAPTPPAATPSPAGPAPAATPAQRPLAQVVRPSAPATAIAAAPAGAAAVATAPGPVPAAPVVSAAPASRAAVPTGASTIQSSVSPASAATASGPAPVATTAPAPTIAATAGTTQVAAASDTPAVAAAPVAPVAASRAPIELAARAGSGSGGGGGDDCFGWALARADGRERVLPAGASFAALGGGSGTCPVLTSGADAGSARLLSAERTDIRAGEAARGRIGGDASSAPPLLFILDARGRIHDARAFLTRDAAGWSYDIPLTLPRGTSAMRTLIVAIPAADAARLPAIFAATPLGDMAPALDAMGGRFAISALTVRSP
ncbi:hypothetical protein [Antarcticirhabdus aurantiaca]|uniref:Uncharacterized protein n=1 Tax=Antarcticirhabdus aurantiaca TaxID=2606717 RepID=A0ACD4NVB0_9HYPH|nr:hypothetical protein [Antarcticirhabdus aurantiaca]WAJ30794.1 hypothetical protein OXU80_11575 [Jeongeuplla avenae]